MTLNLRSLAFWSLDYLRGSPIGAHYSDVARKIPSSSIQIRKDQELQFAKILNHATQTTPFYQSFKDAKNLSDLPVINKLKILDDYNLFRSSSFPGDNLKRMSTSGSTGVPFHIFQNSLKRTRVLADLIYFSGQVGYNVGERHALFRIIDPSTAKSRLKLFLQNEILLNVISQNNIILEHQRNYLKRSAPVKALVGYASALHALADYVLDKGDVPDSFRVQGAICLSELLTPTAKATICKAFGCLVVSRYSNQECGVLAQQRPGSNYFDINTASFIVEILKTNNDDPAEPDEEGRIVVTDLYNMAMPLLRYDTGDTGIGTTMADGRFVLNEISGRKADRLRDANDTTLSPFALAGALHGIHGLRQYQVIQTSKAIYSVKITSQQEVSHDKVAEALKSVLGEAVKLNIENVSELPVLASGKRKAIVQNYYP